MKAFDFPTKKNFEQDFIFRGKVFFTLKYKQATLEEFFDFYGKSPEEQYQELYDILDSQIPRNPMQKILAYFGYKTRFEKALEKQEIIQNIQKNRFRIYDSIFTEIDSKKVKKVWKWGLFSASLKAICSGYNTSIREVMEYLTLEQFLWLSDGLRYEANLHTKEGKNENNLALIDKEAVKRRAEETRKAFENNK